MTVVLDTWAVSALLRDEPAAEHVQHLLVSERSVMSSVNLGEVYYVALRDYGSQLATTMVERMRRSIEIEHPDWPLVRTAAEIKARGGLSYADAFCVATAQRHSAPLYTGDPEIIALDGDDLQVVDLRTAP
jgi:PIN domain nuclease of toxin-antitoxin system